MTSIDHFGVGLIGVGVGQIYAGVFRSIANYYDDLPPVTLEGVASTHTASGERARRRFGFRWSTTDYRELIRHPDVNTLVIAVPNDLHEAILAEALPTGKAIYMDKPLALDLEQARRLLALGRAHGNDAQMIFEFRFSPAMQMARRLIAEQRLGQIYAFRGRYFRSSYIDPQKPLRWKGSIARGGSGVLGDLGAHVIDLVAWLAGQPQRALAQVRTFISERPEGPQGAMIPVETDDHVIVQLAMQDGAIGTIEAGRLITGAQNDLQIEVYGSQGSLRWNLQDGNHLYFADQRQPADERGWMQIATNSRYPGVFAVGADLPAGMVRYHIAAAADFLRRSIVGRVYDPNLLQGARVQAVLEAAALSSKQNAWIEIQALD
jgi:predicted dehydrogenase